MTRNPREEWTCKLCGSPLTQQRYCWNENCEYWNKSQHLNPRRRFVDTTWELRSYDVWGNSRDGYEVNDSYVSNREYPIRIAIEVNNAGTPQQFESAFPSDSQIREALSLRRFKIETDGDDLSIYVTRARDGYPCGEMFCTSHKSLSPIKKD